MDEQAEQLVLDYLRRAGDAAHGTLRTDQRLDFVRRLRARIEEFSASAGAEDAEHVRKVLRRFGDPAALVRREQKRLEQEQADRAAAVQAEQSSGPSVEQSVRQQEGGAGEATSDEGPTNAPDEGATSAPDEGGPITEPIPTVRSGGGEQASDTLRHPTRNMPQARPHHSGPPLYQPRSPREAGQTVPSAVSGLFDALPPPVRDTLRGGVLEAVGLVLVGVGGALAPLPLWFIGAIVVSLAAGWSLSDRLLGLLPPPVLALVGPAVFAAVGYGGGHSYLLELRTHGWTFFRVGAALGAIYLAAVFLGRLRKNRSSSPPWKPRNPR